MTKDEIIRMAREAGFTGCLLPEEADNLIGGVFINDENWAKPLERFAAIVREDCEERIAILEQDNDNCRKVISDLTDALNEREKQQDPVAWLCGKCVDNFSVDGYETCEQGDYGAFPVYTTPPTIEAAVLAEREACAKVCEGIGWGNNPYVNPKAGTTCAAAIRSMK